MLQQQCIRRGIAGFFEFTALAVVIYSSAQSPDNAGSLTQMRQCMAEPLGARCLAIGTGDGNHQHAFVGFPVISMGDLAAKLLEAARRMMGDAPCCIPGKFFTLVQHCRGTVFQCLCDIGATVCSIARVGKKHVAGLYLARIRHQFSASRSNAAQPLLDVLQLHCHGFHHKPSCGPSVGMMMSVTLESGGTFRARKAFAATVANTGAATSPP